MTDRRTPQAAAARRTEPPHRLFTPFRERAAAPPSPAHARPARYAWVAAAALALLSAPAAAENAVTTWDEHVATAASTGRAPASAEYLHALAHLAVWDAVVSIRGGHEPYLGVVPVTAPASLDAAVAAAAYHVAAARMPPQADALAAQYAAYLAGIPDGAEKANGIAAGLAAAEQLLAARASDGYDPPATYVQPAPGPGVFEPVAPTPPVDVRLAVVAPLLPRGIDEYRPPGPPALRSRRYASDFEEVKTYGRLDGARSAEQTEVARFWSDHTFRQYARSLRELAIARGLDTFETSRFLAKVHLAAGDAVLAGFEAKYHFLAWRPVHAIARADTDGNARTAADPSWAAFLTVNHPEYPSGHSFLTGAVTGAVKRYFGTEKVPWTISSAATGTSRTYATLREIRDEVGDARVWSGLHFRQSMVDGDRLGQRIAALASRSLRPLEDCEDEDDGD